MTEERPDDARGADGPVAPDTGDDGLEARPASAPDAPFSGLRSAADIFGAPRTEDDWPSRRERREAERAAQEAGVPAPDPFVPAPESAPAPASAPSAASESEADPLATQAMSLPEDDPLATQAISMPEELAALSGVAGRVPPPAVVPPVTNAPDPRAITLPTANAARDTRAAEARALEEERRRLDPDGTGRTDVDWLGRARQTPDPPAPSGTPFPVTGPIGVPQPVGVEGVLPSAPAPSTTEPPSFTELLRLQDESATGPQEGRPFDWSILGDDTGEVPATLTSAAYDTNLVAADSWVNAPVPPVVPAAPTVLDAQAPDAAASGVARSTTAAGASGAATAGEVSAAPVDPSTPDATEAMNLPAAAPARGDDVADEVTTPSGSSWSLSDEAARTGEVFPGDVEVPEDLVPAETADATAVFGLPAVRRSQEDDARGDDVRGSDAGVDTRTAEARAADARWDDARWADARWEAARRDAARRDATEPSDDDRADQDPSDVGTDHHVEPDHDDVHDEHDAVSTPPRSAAALPSWDPAESGVLPPLVPPTDDRHDGRATRAGATGDLGGLPVPRVPDEHDEHDRYDEPEVVGAVRGPAPEDLDQSEWDGRETSDTSVIKDLFGTEAVHQLGATGYDPHDTGTRMMPAVQPGPDAPAAVTPGAGERDDHGNFITEGFGRLQSEGRRGKQLLVYGSIAAIVVLLVLVFILTRVLLGNTIEDHPAPPTKSPAAAAAPLHPLDQRS